MPQKLVGTETIRDVLQKLAHPESYVRGVLANMIGYRKEHGGNPEVRIGCTGEGIYPHYRIERENVGDIETDVSGFLKLATFNGRNHRQMEWGAFEIRGEHWSASSMGLTEIQEVLGELRGYKGKRST